METGCFYYLHNKANCFIKKKKKKKKATETQTGFLRGKKNFWQPQSPIKQYFVELCSDAKKKSKKKWVKCITFKNKTVPLCYQKGITKKHNNAPHKTL